jgi:hypothetical protein
VTQRDTAEKVSFKKWYGIKLTTRMQKILSKDNSYHIGDFILPSEEFTKSDQELAKFR